MNMQSLEGRFIYYTECNLATLESLKRKKSTAKCEITRQTAICDGMIQVIKDLPINPADIPAGNPRVKERLTSV